MSVVFRRLIVLISVSLLPFALSGMMLAQSEPAHVTVSAGAPGVPIPATAIGVNTAVWQPKLTDPDIAPRLRAAGVTALRYPGGSTSDVYDWQANASTEGTHQKFSADNDFDAFMGLARKAQVTPIITVNYGSNPAGTAGGDPGTAAAWVHYANDIKHYGVKYWEIGNEVYGNGEYGGHWEKDLHADHSPAAYGQNVVQFARAMKAQDPKVQIGAVLTTPGNWPDGQTPDWNSAVLSACGHEIGFVIVHWYPQNPGKESDAGLLASTTAIPGMVAQVRKEIQQYCGTNASQIQIMLTETNSVSSNPGKQTVSIVNGLFLADDFLSWLENGVANVDWWALFNGPTMNANNSPSLFGTANYGDYGLLATGGGPEPPLGTPFPAYYALALLSHLDRPGGRFLPVTSSQSLLAVHAVRLVNGDVAVLLINKDPDKSHSVTISVTGRRLADRATVDFYGPDSLGITQSALSGHDGRYTYSAAPYSLAMILLTRQP